MPTYAYRCTQCDHAFDIYQQFSDASLTECPECGGKLRKVFGTLGVTFNGSGFYRTDSREGAKTGAPSSGGSSGGSGDGASKAGGSSTSSSSDKGSASSSSSSSSSASSSSSSGGSSND